MTKKIAIIFVIILIFFVGGLFIFLQTTSRSEPAGLVNKNVSPSVNPAFVATASAKIVQVEVDYTDSGFSPEKITVKKGTAVVFYNRSKTDMSIKSDLPEFNQTIEGKVYAYTFSQTGSWSFQNQKKLTDQGIIKVTD